MKDLLCRLSGNTHPVTCLFEVSETVQLSSGELSVFSFRDMKKALSSGCPSRWTLNFWSVIHPTPKISQRMFLLNAVLFLWCVTEPRTCVLQGWKQVLSDSSSQTRRTRRVPPHRHVHHTGTSPSVGSGGVRIVRTLPRLQCQSHRRRNCDHVTKVLLKTPIIPFFSSGRIRTTCVTWRQETGRWPGSSPSTRTRTTCE